MIIDLILPIGTMVLGAWLMWHCPRAGIRELRAGLAEGQLGEYPRDENPVRFWATIVLTFAAGLIGLLFVVFGLALFLSNVVGGK